MGYLQKRKNQANSKLFINAALTSLSLLIALSVFNKDIRDFLFQYYALATLFCFFSFYSRQFFQGMMFAILFIWSFFMISSHANIFFNPGAYRPSDLRLIYQNQITDISSVVGQASSNRAGIIALNQYKLSDVDIFPYQDYFNSYRSSFISTYEPLDSGKTTLASKYEISYFVVQLAKSPVVFINLDISDITDLEKALVFSDLKKFVINQDFPVIIVGDFGVPVWDEDFSKFLDATELEVKNRLIFTRWQDAFKAPSINVLGHSNSSVNTISILDAKNNSTSPMLIELAVN